MSSQDRTLGSVTMVTWEARKLVQARGYRASCDSRASCQEGRTSPRGAPEPNSRPELATSAGPLRHCASYDLVNVGVSSWETNTNVYVVVADDIHHGSSGNSC